MKILFAIASLLLAAAAFLSSLDATAAPAGMAESYAAIAYLNL